ncbi:MAG: alkaline phosphatase family protein [Spirochaetales bacterium]
MNSSETTVEQGLSDGALLHPTEDALPSFLDVVRYVARLGGANPPGERRAEESIVAGHIGTPEHTVFILADGLGLNNSMHFPAGGALERGLACEVRALFPSTTTVVLTALATGRWPAENGVTGWWTRATPANRTISPLRWIEQFSERPASEIGLTVSDIVEHEPLLSEFSVDSASFLHTDIAGGTYAEWSRGGTAMIGYRDYSDVLEKIVARIRDAGQPTYSYVYLTEVDHAGHKHGYDSPECAGAVAAIDVLLRRLEERLVRQSGQTRIIVIGDHGQIIVPPERSYRVFEGDPLEEFLVCPPTGEGTTPVFHVRPGMESAFRRSFSQRDFGSVFTLVEPEALSELGFYGDAPLSPSMRERLGTYVGISSESAMFEYVSREGHPLGHRGAHGGLRPEEMRLGLFVL